MYIFNMAGWGSAKPGPGYNSSHRDDMNQRCSFPGKAMRHLRRHALNILTFFGVLSVMGHIFLLQYTSDSLLKREPHSEKNMEKYMHYGDSVIKTNQKFEKSGDLSYHKEEVPWDEPKHARLFKGGHCNYHLCHDILVVLSLSLEDICIVTRRSNSVLCGTPASHKHKLPYIFISCNN